jgi:hypothetical protein
MDSAALLGAHFAGASTSKILTFLASGLPVRELSAST